MIAKCGPHLTSKAAFLKKINTCLDDILPVFLESYIITAADKVHSLHLFCISGCHGKGPPSHICPVQMERGTTHNNFWLKEIDGLRGGSCRKLRTAILVFTVHLWDLQAEIHAVAISAFLQGSDIATSTAILHARTTVAILFEGYFEGIFHYRMHESIGENLTETIHKLDFNHHDSVNM